MADSAEIKIKTSMDTSDVDKATDELKELKDLLKEGGKVRLEADTAGFQKSVKDAVAKAAKENKLVIPVEAKAVVKQVQDGGKGQAKSTAGVKKEGDAEAGEDIQAKKQKLMKALDELDKKAGQFGTVAGKRVQNVVSEMRKTLQKAADGDISGETLVNMRGSVMKLVEAGNKLPPKGLAKMGDQLVGVVHQCEDFAKAYEEATGIDWKFNISGFEKFDTLQEKLEMVSKAKGMDDGIKELQAAIATLDPSKAESLSKSTERIAELMTQEITPEVIAKLTEEYKRLEGTVKSLATKDLVKVGPAMNSAKKGFDAFKSNAGTFGAKLKQEFDLSTFSASALSGNVEGLTRGFIGLAAGAKVTGTAIKAAMASTVILAVVMAVQKVVELITDYVTKLRQAREETTKIRMDNLAKAIDDANAKLDLHLKKIDLEKEKIENANGALKNKIDILNGVANAYDEVAKAKALSEAKSDREREEIEKSFSQKREDRESGGGLESAMSDYKTKIETIGRDEEALSKKESVFAENEKSLAGIKKELDYDARKLRARGYGIKMDEEANVFRSYTPDEVAAQWAHNNGYGSVEWGWRSRDIKAYGGTGIDEQTVKQWEKDNKKFIDRDGDVNFRTKENHSRVDTFVERFTKAAEKMSEKNKAQQDAKIGIDKDKEALEREKRELEALKGKVLEGIAKREATALNRSGEMKRATQDSANRMVVNEREMARSREDAFAYDSDRAGIISRRMDETKGFMDAYDKGGTDENGNTIEEGIFSIRQSTDDYERMVKERAAAEKVAASKVKGSTIEVTEEEKRLAQAWEQDKSSFDELSKKVEKGAAALPGLLSRWEAQKSALDSLQQEMNRLAAAYRDEARSTRIARADRDYQRGESKWGRDFSDAGEGEQLAMLRRKESENQGEVDKWEGYEKNDMDNRAKFARIQKKTADGEGLTEEEQAFMDAQKDQDKQKKVRELERLLEEEALSEEPDALDEEGQKKQEERRKQIEELKKETESYRIFSSKAKEIMTRELNYAEQKKEQAKQQLHDMEKSWRQGEEQRKHSWELSDADFMRDRAKQVGGSLVAEGIARQQMEENERKYKEAQAKLEAAHQGKIKLTDDEQKIVERDRDEGRSRFEAARSETMNAEVSRKNRYADFRADIGKNSNRLTALGLGGGGNAGDWSKSTAENTKEMLKLMREQLKTFKGAPKGKERIAGPIAVWGTR